MPATRRPLSILCFASALLAACSGGETVLGETDEAGEAEVETDVARDAPEDAGDADATADGDDEDGRDATDEGEDGVPACGNGICNMGETAASCPADCSDACGDGSCAEAEDQFDCPADCGATGVAVGADHACALLADGTVACWGDNEDGDLGDGTTERRTGPVKVVELDDAVEIRAGPHYSCARLADGSMRCWGLNWSGQLGDGTRTSSPTPVDVTGVADAIGMACGGMATYLSRPNPTGTTCALRSGGTVSCWGSGWDGTDWMDPTPVDALLGSDAISVHPGECCGVFVSGGVACSGGGTLLSAEQVVELSLGDGHSCAILSDGTARCWGGNSYGELGNGTTDTSSEPTTVNDLADAVSITVGMAHSCAVRLDRTAWCWGLSGNGTRSSDGYHGILSVVPARVPGIDGVAAISSGGVWSHIGGLGAPDYYYSLTCAVLVDGSAWCWGVGVSPDVSPWLDSLVPVQVEAW